MSSKLSIKILETKDVVKNLTALLLYYVNTIFSIIGSIKIGAVNSEK